MVNGSVNLVDRNASSVPRKSFLLQSSLLLRGCVPPSPGTSQYCKKGERRAEAAALPGPASLPHCSRTSQTTEPNPSSSTKPQSSPTTWKQQPLLLTCKGCDETAHQQGQECRKVDPKPPDTPPVKESRLTCHTKELAPSLPLLFNWTGRGGRFISTTTGL